MTIDVEHDPKNLSTPEPDPVATGGPAIWDLVIADMHERDQSGRAKYGTPLQAGNGRDALVDAYQEALDLAVYMRQAMAEDWRGRALRAEAEVVELRARLASLRPSGELITQIECGELFDGSLPTSTKGLDSNEVLAAAVDFVADSQLNPMSKAALRRISAALLDGRVVVAGTDSNLELARGIESTAENHMDRVGQSALRRVAAMIRRGKVQP